MPRVTPIGSVNQRFPLSQRLEPSLWAFHSTEHFRDAVLKAVNLGEDADTTGAVCGQLAGVCWGVAGILPQ
jgi:ADP-ribosyl-[dinitrogen reductase] hydrolase